jgi:ubiquinone/menaquinone biosynthesis C-methylase UbiE
MEFENTVDYLDRYLPDTGRVLDVGGASGRYALWLAERGRRTTSDCSSEPMDSDADHDVTLVDVSETQVELARENAAERELADRITAEVGDVRDLRFADEQFDAVCCLGGP